MRPSKSVVAWVVYRMTTRGNKTDGNVVCEQEEWNAMELSQPGQHTLIRAGISTEEEAEKLARGTSGDPVPRRSSREANLKSI
jgi:hypothetical protein